MAKKKPAEVVDNAIVIENVGPIKEAKIPYAPGCVTVIEGTNGAGKTEILGAINALAGLGTDGLTVRDGEESGRIAGFGCEVKLTLRQSRRTGMLDILVVEEGFSLANFVRPGLKDPVANDRRRLQDLASVLGVQVPLEAVYDLLGRGSDEDPPEVQEACRADGRQCYRSVVTDATIKAKDPAAFVTSLKRDLDRAALEWEKEAMVWNGEADGMQATLPSEDEMKGEFDADILRDAVLQASEAKRELEEQGKRAVEMKELAEHAKRVMETGVGKTSASAKSELQAAKTREAESRQMILELEQAIRDERARLAVLVGEVEKAEGEVLAAEDREKSFREAEQLLLEKCTPPTEEQLRVADEALKSAEERMLRGGKIREAHETSKRVEKLRCEAQERSRDAQLLREAAKAAVGLLVAPINAMGVGVEVDEQMRLVVTQHPVRGRCYVDDLSAGEGWALAIRLMAQMHGGDEIPALVAIPQEAYEGLDGHNRRMLVEAVAKTKLIVVTAVASQQDVSVLPVSGSIVGGGDVGEK